MAPVRGSGNFTEPVAKRAKAPSGAEAEVEALQESETDSKLDERPRLKEPVAFATEDTTLNVVPTTGGRVLMCLQEGGMQYLIAGARANVGIKAGRYMFEVRILEALQPFETPPHDSRRVPAPRQMLRVGFSTIGSSLILGDGDAHGVCFDSEGVYSAGAVRRPADAARRFGRHQVVGVLLNLESTSQNANTISLFRDGIRVSEPQRLPDELLGKPLFPHVAFRNITLQVHFGPQALMPLAFQCRGIEDACVDDVLISKRATPKDGKAEVLFPVCFPDEGGFDWLDSFLEKNPEYTELSDRMILDWAAKSGLCCKGGGKGAGKSSNDKPAFHFDVPMMDDFSVRHVLSAVTTVVPRNYVLMEVKQNLVEQDRKFNVKRFPKCLFRRVARVVMGEPSDDFKKLVKDKLLKAKQRKLDSEWRARRLEKERKKLMDQRRKELEKEMMEKRRKELEDKLMKENKAEDEAKEEKAEEGVKAEPEDVKEETKEEDKEDDEAVAPPVATLTEDEAACWFPKKTLPDLSHQVLDRFYANFSLPSTDDGFDAISFEWQDEKCSAAYLRKWVLDRKQTSRVEDLQPGEWFRATLAEWATKLEDWVAKQKMVKSQADGKREEDEDKWANTDILSISDINDVGAGDPLYLHFTWEDWALLSLRFELRTLAVAYRQDVNDNDRTEIPEAHLGFYFNRYFRRKLNPKLFGVDTLAEVVGLIKDTVSISERGTMIAVEEKEDLDIFVKLTEQSRRERQRRIDAGDETARLKLLQSVPSEKPPPPPPAPMPPAVSPSASDHGHQQYAPREYAPRWQGKGFGKGKGKQKVSVIY